MQKFTIAKYAELANDQIDIVPAPGDDTVTMAHLAIYNEFSVDGLRDTRAHLLAFEALVDEYSKGEMPEGEGDWYDGFHVTFGDGSQLIYRYNDIY